MSVGPTRDVIVEVRAAGHLPEPEVARVAIEQAVGQVAASDVGLGLEFEHRNAEVATDRGRGGSEDTGSFRFLGQWRAGAELAVDEKPVIHMGDRLTASM